MLFVFQVLARMPLRLLHAMGAALGWAVFLLDPAYRHNFAANAAQAGLAKRQWRAAVSAAGRLALEVPRLWLGKPVAVRWHGEDLVDSALALGHGLVFITPHLGCFEVAAQAYAQRFGASHPMTALYRPARQSWLAQLEAHARARPGLHTAPTTLAGVRQMLKALKAGQVVGLLPDQVPPLGQGVWLPFFGKPAYTMTLSVRLAQMTGAATLLVWGERLTWGRGYIVHVLPVPNLLGIDPAAALATVNQVLEAVILKNADQYLWGYARYKHPRSE